MGKPPNEKNSSSGCGTYVQYLVRGICMVFVPVFVAWIWWHHHNKGTVDRRLSTIALLSLAGLWMGKVWKYGRLLVVKLRRRVVSVDGVLAEAIKTTWRLPSTQPAVKPPPHTQSPVSTLLLKHSKYCSSVFAGSCIFQPLPICKYVKPLFYIFQCPKL